MLELPPRLVTPGLAKTELNLEDGEATMLIPDMPNIPPQSSSFVIVAQNNKLQQSVENVERAIGVCKLVDNEEKSGTDGERLPNSDLISSVWSAIAYLKEYEHRNDFTDEDVSSAKATILQQPQHGSLVVNNKTPAITGRYTYTPEVGYVGKDSAVLMVEIKGMKVKVSYFIHVLNYPILNHWDEMCGEKGGQWKISANLDANGKSTITAVDYQAAPIDTAALAFILGSSVLSGTSGITLNIADLPAGALGQTTGTSITLDDNAAENHGVSSHIPTLSN